MDYWGTKLRALVILDAETKVDLLKQYEKKYNAKTELFRDLAISADRMGVMADVVNASLKAYPNYRSLTSAALAGCKTVGDYIKKYCGAARIKLESGEPT